ncbi:extracellular solute-binding protein [Candidatus Bipolaricaulota bacterium]|nr:extracellular solute-binding protein [Candidatus Bipolaricaulota bacterium]
MKKITLGILVLSLTVGLALSFSTTSFSQDEKIKLKAIGGLSSPYKRITFLGPDEPEKAREHVSESHYNHFPLISYNQANPDKQVDLDIYIPPFSDLMKEEMLALTGGDPYDVMVMDHMWLGKFAESGYLEDKYSDVYEKWADDFGMYEGYRNGSSYEGTFYGLWRSTDSRALWVWKDVLHAAGYTMEDIKSAEGLLEALPEINKVAKKEFGMEGAMEFNFSGKSALGYWYGWLYQLGGKILKKNEDGEWRAGFDNEGAYKAANYLKKLDEAGATLKRTWQYNLTNFLDRRYAMTFEGGWNVSDLNTHWPDKTPEEIQVKVGMVPQPTFKGKEMRTLTGGFIMVIPKAGNNKDLMNHIMMDHLFRNEKNYAHMLLDQGKFPTSEKIFENEIYQEGMLEKMPDEWYSKFKKAIAGGILRPYVPEYSSIAQEIWIALQKVVSGKATAEKAFSAAANKVNNMMKED